MDAFFLLFIVLGIWLHLLYSFMGIEILQLLKLFFSM